MVAPSGSGVTSISLPTFALPLLAHVTSLLAASSRSPPPASPTAGVGRWREPRRDSTGPGGKPSGGGPRRRCGTSKRRKGRSCRRCRGRAGREGWSSWRRRGLTGGEAEQPAPPRPSGRRGRSSWRRHDRAGRGGQRSPWPSKTSGHGGVSGAIAEREEGTEWEQGRARGEGMEMPALRHWPIGRREEEMIRRDKGRK